MKSKHHLWQRRWTIDAAAGTYLHECGLLVRFAGPGDPTGRANNSAQVLQTLAIKNGHNAAAMLARMMREAAQLHAHGAAARINSTSQHPLPRISN